MHTREMKPLCVWTTWTCVFIILTDRHSGPVILQKAKLWAYRGKNIKPTRTPSLTLKAKLFTRTFLVYSYLHIIIISIRNMCRYVHLMLTKLILNDLDIKWMWMLTQNNKKSKILRRKTPTIMTRIISLIFQKYAKLQHLTVNLTSSRCRETISQDDCCFHL